MGENQKSDGKRRASLWAAPWVHEVLQGVLAFIWVACALILIGITYAYFPLRRLDFGAIASWFLRLSSGQWIALAVGMCVALLLVVFPCAKIAGRKKVYEEEPRSRRPRRLVQAVAVLAVLLLYFAGLGCAYRVSLGLGHTRDWAIIHSLYSWVYVGFSFAGWLADHRQEPLWRALREFFKLIGT